MRGRPVGSPTWPGAALLLGLVVAVLGTESCKASPSGGPPTAFVTQTVGPSGGDIAGPNGLSVLFPVNAVPDDVAFTLGALEASAAPAAPAGFVYASPVFSLEPHGFAFAMPVTVTIPGAAFANTFHASCPASTAQGSSQGCQWDGTPVSGVSGGAFPASSFSLYAVVTLPDGGAPYGIPDGGCLAASADAGPASGQLLSDCGDVTMTSIPTCQLLTGASCQAQCVATNMLLSCAAKLEASCAAGCTASVQSTCTSSCEASCTGGCSADPATFACEGACEQSCEGQCPPQCSSSASPSECTMSCQQSCATGCHAQCGLVAPSAPCDSQCAAACQGSCVAQANLGCDVGCETQGDPMCESMLETSCTAQCGQATGALFCNGQYVDVEGGAQVQACAAQIEATFGTSVSCGS